MNTIDVEDAIDVENVEDVEDTEDGIDADDIVDNGVDAANDIEDVTFVGGLVVATKLLTGFTSYNYS